MLFFEKNEEFAKRNVLVDDQNQVVTYQDWYDYADSLQQIIPPRSLVFILCRNTIGSVLSYLCCLQNRIVPLLINDDMNEELLADLIKVYKPNYVVKPLNHDFALPNNELVYDLFDYGVYPCYAAEPVELFSELALLLTTSGSTGSPKLVRQSYKNIQANAASIAAYLELDAQQRPISSLPMYYTFGLSVIHSHLVCGAAIYITEATIMDAAFWEFMKEKNITSLAGVPFTYECLQRLRFFTLDLPDLKLMLQAGGKLSKRLHQEYGEFAVKTNKRFVVMYGQTEATARMSYLPPQYCLEKIGSIGVAIPGGVFRIMEDAHKEITEPLAVGELCYEGDNVTLGYACCAADLKAGDENQGRLFTGDIAYRDAAGFYYITGRKKRFVKMQGKRVNLDEIEQIFKNEYTTYDFACIGEDDALTIYTTAPEADLAVLADFLTDKVNLHPALFQMASIAAIPKNSSGKTQYTDLQPRKD
ncbi:MAG: AMP-binding protein [Sporomusaceae bacterium]|nr:AMP-binding protein [Sporomusaceae bacterium]